MAVCDPVSNTFFPCYFLWFFHSTMVVSHRHHHQGEGDPTWPAKWFAIIEHFDFYTVCLDLLFSFSSTAVSLLFLSWFSNPPWFTTSRTCTMYTVRYLAFSGASFADFQVCPSGCLSRCRIDPRSISTSFRSFFGPMWWLIQKSCDHSYTFCCSSFLHSASFLHFPCHLLLFE